MTHEQLQCPECGAIAFEWTVTESTIGTLDRELSSGIVLRNPEGHTEIIDQDPQVMCFECDTYHRPEELVGEFENVE